jgi:hypothetical protein
MEQAERVTFRHNVSGSSEVFVSFPYYITKEKKKQKFGSRKFFTP